MYKCASSEDLINQNNLLVYDGYYVFPNEQAFVDYKDFVYSHQVHFQFASETEMNQYYTDHHITSILTEVDDPNLTNYVRLVAEHF